MSDVIPILLMIAGCMLVFHGLLPDRKHKVHKVKSHLAETPDYQYAWASEQEQRLSMMIPGDPQWTSDGMIEIEGNSTTD